jgi:hypothetical protein
MLSQVWPLHTHLLQLCLQSAAVTASAVAICCVLQELTADLPARSLFLLGKQNPLRKAAVYAITNKFFDYAMLATIVANCVTLGMYSHQPGFDETPLGQFLQASDYYFLGVFSVEMLLKVLAMGLVLAPGTYLRSGE